MGKLAKSIGNAPNGGGEMTIIGVWQSGSYGTETLQRDFAEILFVVKHNSKARELDLEGKGGKFHHSTALLQNHICQFQNEVQIDSNF